MFFSSNSSWRRDVNLLLQYRAGGPDSHKAFEEIFKSVRGLMIWVYRKWSYANIGNKALSDSWRDDAISHGCVILIKCLNGYDPTHKHEVRDGKTSCFSTYFCKSFWNAMSRMYEVEGRCIKFQWYVSSRYKNSWQSNIDLPHSLFLRSIPYEEYKWASSEWANAHLFKLYNLEASEIECSLEINETLSVIRNALSYLDKVDRGMIRLRFGFDGGKEHTLDEISKIYGVTKERVRQRCNRALLKMLPYFRRHINDFDDGFLKYYFIETSEQDEICLN